MKKLFKYFFVLLALVTFSLQVFAASPEQWLMERAEAYKDYFGNSEPQSYYVEGEEVIFPQLDSTIKVIKGNTQYKLDTKVIEAEKQSFTEKEERIIIESKTKVSEFIRETQLIHEEDKSKLISYIQSIQFYLVNFDSEISKYEGLYQKGAIYINAKEDRVFNEWVAVHEMVHAMADYLNPDAWLQTGYFMEGMTDVLTLAILQNRFMFVMSGYIDYSEIGLVFVNIFSEEALSGYMYGNYYFIAEDEFRIFVDCMNAVEEDKTAQFIVANFLKQWQINN